MENQISMTFSILARQKEGIWIGHCLELDIVATAESLDQLKNDMLDLIVAQVDYAFSNNNLDYLYHPAPKEVWEEFYKCKKIIEDKIDFESQSQKGRDFKTFVPPWIIAKTCLVEDSCIV